jgi:hypothetical protein
MTSPKLLCAAALALVLGFGPLAAAAGQGGAPGKAGVEKQRKGEESDEANEIRVKLEELPAAVRETARRESKGGTVLGYTKEVEKGQTLYELELKVRGHTKDVIIDPAGTIVLVEEEVPIGSLPAAVQAEVKKTLGSARVLKFEAVTRGTTLAGYEAHVKAGGKESEIKMAPDGKPLAPGKEF